MAAFSVWKSLQIIKDQADLLSSVSYGEFSKFVPVRVNGYEYAKEY